MRVLFGSVLFSLFFCERGAVVSYLRCFDMLRWMRWRYKSFGFRKYPRLRRCRGGIAGRYCRAASESMGLGVEMKQWRLRAKYGIAL